MARAAVVRTGKGSGASELWNFLGGFFQIGLWSHLTSQGVSSRFRGTYVGIWWLVLSQLAFSGGVGFIWSRMFNLNPAEFIPYVGIGFPMWGFFSACVVDGCSTMIVSGAYLRQMRLPLSIFILRQFFTQTTYLMIGLVVAVGLMLVLGVPLRRDSVWVFAGLGVILFTMFWVVALMSFAGARYRDLTYGIGSLFQALFVVTPVIYPTQILRERGLDMFIVGNPFALMLDLVRVPLLEGRSAEWLAYAIVGGVGVAAMTLTLLLVCTWGRRLVYWL
jgi:ABC-type polysaccharide/polyol phosphate export permease